MTNSGSLEQGRLLPWIAVSVGGFAALWIAGMVGISFISRIFFFPEWTGRLAGFVSLVAGVPAAITFGVLRAQTVKRKKMNDIENANPADERIRALEEERDFYRALAEGTGGSETQKMEFRPAEAARPKKRRRHSG